MLIVPGILTLLSFTVVDAWCNPTVGKVNDKAYLTALTRTDREARSAKTLWLVPGKCIRWHYAWILEDGSQVDQVLKAPLKGVADERPFSQKHPNIYAAAVGLGALSGPAMGMTTGLAIAK